VDRVLGGAAQVSAPDVSYAVLVLFFGGPDDREALAYAARMGEHPGIELTVARFITAAAPKPDAASGDLELELAKDEEALQRYVTRALKSGDGSVRYEEVTAAAEREELTPAIRTLGRGKNLVVAGRSAPAPPLVEKSDCPELGPVGSYLATPEFSTTASVLVVQRYNPRSDPSRERPEVEGDVEEAVVPFPSSSRSAESESESRHST
jgi:hypothetical protein